MKQNFSCIKNDEFCHYQRNPKKLVGYCCDGGLVIREPFKRRKELDNMGIGTGRGGRPQGPGPPGL